MSIFTIPIANVICLGLLPSSRPPASKTSATASGISFRTDYGDGKATLTYEEQDWFDENTWTPQTQDYSFSLSGTVTVDDGKPEVSFGD